MARQRVKGGKRIDRHEVKAADGRKLIVDLYMVKRSYDSNTSFRAICDAIGLDETGDDVDELTSRAKKIASERSDASWEPYLYVTVTGERGRVPDPDEALEPVELFDSRSAYSGERNYRTRFNLEIEVNAYELATIEGKKVHRRPPEKGPGAHVPLPVDGWPETGRRAAHRYWGEPQRLGDMRALIRDTPHNRTALIRIREAMESLTERLDDLLSPEKVEETIAAVLAGIGPLALPGPQKPTMEELARGKDMRSGPRHADDCEGRPRVRRKSPREDS